MATYDTCGAATRPAIFLYVRGVEDDSDQWYFCTPPDEPAPKPDYEGCFFITPVQIWIDDRLTLPQLDSLEAFLSHWTFSNIRGKTE